MKKSDIAMIIIVASLSVMVAFFVARSIFGDVYNNSVKVKTIDKISSEVVEPDIEIFNKTAINPTVQVQINGNN